MARKISLACSVADSLRAKARHSWFSFLSVRERVDLLKIKRRWQAGEYVDGNGRRASANAIAQAIADNLNERKISTVGRQGVLAWLKLDRP